jgi:hypothetical protein
MTKQLDLEDVIVWPDNTWCYRYELHQMGHMSDDYLTIPFGSLHYPDGITIIDPDYDKIVKSRQTYAFRKG